MWLFNRWDRHLKCWDLETGKLLVFNSTWIYIEHEGYCEIFYRKFFADFHNLILFSIILSFIVF
jgi:hypothetical protein